jgi:hypothetical protein
MRDRGSRSILICSIIPQTRMHISSLGCLGGGVFSPFPCATTWCCRRDQLEYVQRYVSSNIVLASEFQVPGGQLQIGAFQREDVSFLCYFLLSLSQYSFDG